MVRRRRPPTPIAQGYEQVGEVDPRIELTEGVLALIGPARRVHVWGAPYLPDAGDARRRHVAARPVSAHDGQLVEQVLTPAGGGWRTPALNHPSR